VKPELGEVRDADRPSKPAFSTAAPGLDDKLKQKRNNLWKAIAACDGSGTFAIQYAASVKAFAEYCAAVTGE
jgi:hypothetical protein